MKPENEELLRRVVDLCREQRQCDPSALIFGPCPGENDLQKFLNQEPEFAHLEEHLAICDQCRDLADQIMAQNHAERLLALARRELKKAAESAEGHLRYAWAAAAPEQPHSGTTTGMAVYGDGVTTDRVECCAWVSEQLVRKGRLEILGLQVTTLADGSQATGPIDYLEEKLESLFFINPYLQAFHLAQRERIFIDIGAGKVLAEAECLTLAIVMAVVKVAAQAAPRPSTIYAAGLDLNGTLCRIGRINSKIQGARTAGFTDFVIAAEQFDDIRPELKDTNSGLTFHCFNSLREVLSWEELLPLQFAENEQNQCLIPSRPTCSLPPAAAPSPADRTYDFLAEGNYQPLPATVISRLLAMAENICLGGGFRESEEMILLVGDAEDMDAELPPASFALAGPPLRLPDGLETLKELAQVIETGKLGVGITPDGLVRGFYRLKKYDNRPEISSLLQGRNRHNAILARESRSTILFLRPGERQVSLFADGRLLARFRNGCWQTGSPETFIDILRNSCRRLNLDRGAAEIAAAAAFHLAEKGLGATFVFSDHNNEGEHQLWEPTPETQLKFTVRPQPLNQIALSEIEIMGRREGAVIIDREGFLVAFGVRFTQEIKIYPGINLRQQHAAEFSRAQRTLALTAGRDGFINLYACGERIARL